jgi:hypothetical protein
LRRGCSLRVDSYVEYRALELKRLARQWAAPLWGARWLTFSFSRA